MCVCVVVLVCQNVFERFHALVYALICAGCGDSVCVCSSVVCVVFYSVFVYVLCLRLCFGPCVCVLGCVSFLCLLLCSFGLVVGRAAPGALKRDPKQISGIIPH